MLQFGLGTCYAMSAADGIESVNYIKTGSLVELSAQEILDCVPGHSRLCDRDARFCGGENSSCAGKSGGNVARNFRNDSGKGKRDRLRKDTVTINGFKIVGCENEEALLRAVIRQPVIVHLYIECDNFYMYRGGVRRGPNPNVERDNLKDKMDHYGLVVGLDTEKSGKGKKAVDYWILKNPWGSSWGIEGGYMRLLRNSGRPEGICGVNLFAVYPIKRTDNPPPFQDKLIRNNSRFKLSAPTPHAFRRRSLKAAAQPNKVLELLSLFIIELSIVEHGMNLAAELAAEGQHPSTESLSSVPLNYVEQKFDRMRGILIDWLIKVHYKFEQMEETSYLTGNFIDRFLPVLLVFRTRLQLVGATLPCKYQQVFASVLEDLILISDKSYCRKEVFDMEQVLINTLLFNLLAPSTPYAFMRCFLKAAQSDKRLELLSLFMYKRWSEICERHVIYNDDQLMERAKTEPAEFLPVDAELNGTIYAS